MRRITSRVLVLLIFATGCATTVGRDAAHGDRITTLKDRLAEVRGLPFTAEVPILFETRESLPLRLEAELQAELGNRNREDISLAYSKLGLLPAGVDLRSTLLNYHSSRAQGFYNPRTKTILLFGEKKTRASSNSPPRGEIDAKVLVHELTHALQDQHFSLGAKLRDSTSGDQRLALRAIAEADAILSEHAYLFGGFYDGLPEYVLQLVESAGQPVSSVVPDVVADKTFFQYLEGLKFVSRVVGDRGWAALNLIYAHPPLSTEQILHPEKYFLAPDPPTHIRLNNLAAVFSKEWREIENDVLGELMVRCLFKQFLSPSEASAVAAGWGGDRFVAYRRGDEVAFVWTTSWDSAQDAQAFFEAYQTIVRKKYDSRPFDRERFYIEKRDQNVLIVEGLECDFVKGSVEAVWGGMETKKAEFEPPRLNSRRAGR